MAPLLDFFRRHPSAEEVSTHLRQYPIADSLRDQFAHHLTASPAYQLNRFNPKFVAEKLNLPVRAALEMLGAAMLSGYVNLNWEVRCPGCGGSGLAFQNLTQAQSEFTCKMCSTHFHAHLDDEIQITFTANEQLRAISEKDNNAEWRAEIDQRLKPTNSHELLTIQMFRDLFIKEPLPAGESFQIKNLTLMFTDLGGSTELYARQGDPRAYSLVREHFNILFDTVASHGGAVVKTIGDAIMAVFPRGDLAIKAAFAAQQDIETYNQERNLQHPDRLRLKIGIHSGPALAVTLNDRLDYFGTVVNAAARVQAEAGHGETIITTIAFNNGDSTDVIDAAIKPEHLTLRGLENMQFEVLRIQHDFASASQLVA